jgi:transcription antitermination factor NusG
MTRLTPSPLDFLTPAPEGWQWKVIHAKPRCEKKVAALPMLKEAEIYLPCTQRVHNYGKRERRYEVPLFTGYVFGRMPLEHIGWYRNNSNVANVIDVVNEQKLLEPLRAIATSLEAGLELDVLPHLGPGTRVLITGGSLKGLETEVQEVSGTNKVIIQLELIQKSVAVEVDVQYLKVLG